MEDHQTHEHGSQHSGAEHHGTEHQDATHATHSAHKMNTNDLKIPKMDFSHLDFAGGFKKFLAIVQLDKKVVEEVATDEKMNAMAAIYLLIGSIASPLAMFIFGVRLFGVAVRADLVSTLISAVVAVVMALAGFVVITLVANRMFKGQGTFEQIFRVMGLVSLLNVISVLGFIVGPLAAILSFAVAIWSLVVSFNVLKLVFKLDNANAVLTVVVGWIALFVLMSVLTVAGLGGSVNRSVSSGVNITY